MSSFRQVIQQFQIIDKDFHNLRIKMNPVLFLDVLQCFLLGPGWSIWAVGDEGIPNVYNSKYSGCFWNGFTI